ncbi:hypothetical protein, partial [Clostridium akagii]|uniref:hypothetical protein n=1 Tax=Clostridium akagii TaxID=91623 RepID=UPI00047A1C5D
MKIDKIISVTLAVFLLTSVFPITVNADQVSSNKASTQNVQTKKVKKEKVGKITKELTEDRT